MNAMLGVQQERKSIPDTSAPAPATPSAAKDNNNGEKKPSPEREDKSSHPRARRRRTGLRQLALCADGRSDAVEARQVQCTALTLLSAAALFSEDGHAQVLSALDDLAHPSPATLAGRGATGCEGPTGPAARGAAGATKGATRAATTAPSWRGARARATCRRSRRIDRVHPDAGGRSWASSRTCANASSCVPSRAAATPGRPRQPPQGAKRGGCAPGGSLRG